MELTDKELETSEIKKLQSEINSLKKALSESKDIEAKLTNTITEDRDNEENLNKTIMQADTISYTTRLLLRSIFNIVSQEYKNISESDINTIRVDLEDYIIYVDNF